MRRTVFFASYVRKATLVILAIVLPVSVYAETKKYTLAEECNRIGKKLGSVSVSDCNQAGLKETGFYSTNGLPILIKEYPPLPPKQPKGKVLLLGGIHGDEYSSVSVVFKWLKTLDKHHSGLFHWHIVPLANPDGLLQEKSSRLNANKVDLNRNLPTPDWDELALNYWAERVAQDPRRYPGKSPASEPETQWLIQEIESFKPDAIVAVHAPYGMLDFDGPNHRPPKKLGFLRLNRLGTYPGSLGRYAGETLKLPVITIELKYAGIMPSSKEISRVWVDMVGWLNDNI